MPVGPKNHMRKYTIYNSVTCVHPQATFEASNHPFERKATFNSQCPYFFGYKNVFSVLRVVTDGNDLTWKNKLVTQSQSSQLFYTLKSRHAPHWGIWESYGKSVFKLDGNSYQETFIYSRKTKDGMDIVSLWKPLLPWLWMLYSSLLAGTGKKMDYKHKS